MKSIELSSLVNVFLFRGIRDDAGNEILVPELAHSWEFEEDGKVVVFHLEEGWTFQDGNDVFAEGEGREIVADDVVYSIERLATIEGTGAASDLISNFVS
ncbi:MAG: ABC transporter substrate-binding protein, partial [Anaerolineaceae bacterium]|nr:ABC transporter substrate-binding protein [Anaerolineaceae bacterium]